MPQRFNRLVIALGCLLCALTATLPIVAQDASKLLKQAQKAAQHHQKDKAIEYLKKAVEAEPKQVQANHALAQAYLHYGPQTKALPYMKVVMDHTEEPGHQQWMDYGKALHVRKRLDEAQEAYKKSDPHRKHIRKITHYRRQCAYAKELMAKPVKAKIANMGQVVNTSYDEYMPFVSADQQRMFFTSRRPGSTGGQKAVDGLPYEDVYVCFNKGGEWTKPRPLDAPINGNYHDACVGISPDGQTIYLYKGTNGGDIYMTELKGGKWIKPKPFEHNSEKYDSQVTISPDNKTMLFVSDRSGSKDIWVCYRTVGGDWSPPHRLGGNVNSPYQEASPFFHTDGKTLFFSSEGHTSMGGLDIFSIEVKNGRGPYGKPKNLGYPINTVQDDLYFTLSPSGKYGYYSSNKPGGKGGQDLYTIIMPEKPEPELAILKGKVKEAFSDKPMEATITVTDNEKNEEVARFKSNANTGEYVVALPSGRNYGITIEKDGHLFHSENVQLSKKEGYKEYKKEIKLVNISRGSKVVLRNIFFETGSANVTRSSMPELKKLASLMKNNPQLRIEVSGHTDNVGDAQLNMQLSQQRAESVKKQLIRMGVARDRLVAKGYGETMPVADNSTEWGRAKNRRTEFKIL